MERCAVSDDEFRQRRDARRPAGPFEDPEAWLTPFSTDDGGKPAASVDSDREGPGKGRGSPPLHSRLGVSAVGHLEPRRPPVSPPTPTDSIPKSQPARDRAAS